MKRINMHHIVARGYSFSDYVKLFTWWAHAPVFVKLITYLYNHWNEHVLFCDSMRKFTSIFPFTTLSVLQRFLYLTHLYRKLTCKTRWFKFKLESIWRVVVNTNRNNNFWWNIVSKILLFYEHICIRVRPLMYVTVVNGLFCTLPNKELS